VRLRLLPKKSPKSYSSSAPTKPDKPLSGCYNKRFLGAPYGNRTRVSAVKGPTREKHLDDVVVARKVLRLLDHGL
jgi:hypothetical protein